MSNAQPDDLFSYLARATDPHTSHAAAKSVDLIRSERVVLDALAEIGPATDDAVIAYLRSKGELMSETRGRNARLALVRKGHVRSAGEALTRSRRTALTWEVVR